MTARARILITGGSGFIGACLARRRIMAGDDVHLVLRAESKMWRLAGLEGDYAPHIADLRDGDALKRVVRAVRPEIIFHLATHGAYPGQRDRATILATNLLGTANLLDALEDLDYQAFIHTGSSSEYGHKNGPMRESEVLEPRTDYGVTKAAATLLCQAEAFRGRPVTTVRVFSAYGPWEEPSRLVPYVMDCCARGLNPKVTSGNQPRDFIYVDDVVDLLERASQQHFAPLLHAGTGFQTTVRAMVETLVAVCGAGRVKAEFGAEPLRPGEPKTWVASLESTTALTGWKPKHDLWSGARAMWQWYNSVSLPVAA